MSFSRTWAFLIDAVVLGHEGRRAGEQLQLHGLVGLGAQAVEVGEHVGHFAGELPLPLEEDAFVGDEDVVEDYGGVVDVDGGRDGMVEEAGTLVDLGLGADHGYAGGVQVDAEGDCVGGVVFLHGPAGRDEHLVAGRGLADVGLGAAHDDAVRTLLHDAHVEVLVLHLLGGPQGAVALDVGEAHGEGQVVLLQVLAVGLHVGGVGGAVLLVHARGDHGDGVQAVLGHELGPGGLAEADPGPELDHLAQPHQVVAGALGLQGEAHPFAVFVDVGEEVLVARVVVHDVVHGDPVVGYLADGVLGHVRHALAVEVHHSTVFQTLEILLGGLESHVNPSPIADNSSMSQSPCFIIV